MLKFFKVLLISTVVITVGGTILFSVASAESDSNDNSSSLNANAGGTTPFTPTTTIKNWHEVK